MTLRDLAEESLELLKSVIKKILCIKLILLFGVLFLDLKKQNASNSIFFYFPH